MLALLSCTVCGLLVPPPTLTLGRRAIVRAAGVTVLGATAPALADEGEFAKQGGFQDRSVALGSGKGVPAYSQMKLSNALQELSEPLQSAPDSLKSTLEVFSATLPLTGSSRLSEIDTARLRSAASTLATLSTTEALQRASTAIGSRNLALLSAVQKGDATAATSAAVTLAEDLTDFAYAFNLAERPLKEIQKGAPEVYIKGKAVVELPVSGKSL